MALETEIKKYRDELPNLLKDEGKFVLVIGDHIVDTFYAYEDALKEGYKQAGLSPFLVKQIHAVERVQRVSRV